MTKPGSRDQSGLTFIPANTAAIHERLREALIPPNTAAMHERDLNVHPRASGCNARLQPDYRFQAKRGRFERVEGLSHENQAQNLALTVIGAMLGGQQLTLSASQ